MGSITWGPEIAEVYDKTYAAQSDPSVLGRRERPATPALTREGIVAAAVG
jgi:hypothetical protein